MDNPQNKLHIFERNFFPFHYFPGKWHDLILHPSFTRYDARSFVMSYIIVSLEHNSVYEVMIQARNSFGWNEVITWLDLIVINECGAPVSIQ